MGLVRQPNSFSCGPYALKHALTMLGVIADPSRLARIAETDRAAGTDEVHLARAARAHDCALAMVRRYDAASARRTLVRTLDEGLPVLVCVDEWEHWVTIVHHARGQFVVLDSREEPVVTVQPWAALERRWAYADVSDEDEELVLYDLFPVRPRTRRRARASFSVHRARELRRAEHRTFALSWDEYLGDLLDICRPRTPLQIEPLTLGELLRRNGEMLIGRVAHWHGAIERAPVERVLHNLRFVADTYGMVVPAGEARRALADLAILLALWVTARVPVAPFYAAAGRRPRGAR